MADSNKTEEATPRHREKAREKGQIARSRELPAVFAMAGVASVLALMSRTTVTHWTTLYRNTLDLAASQDLGTNGPVLFWAMVEVFRWIVPILSAAMLLALAAGLGQGGLVIAPEALSLKFDRLNPASRLSHIFSPVGLSNILKSLLPFSAILWVSVHCIQNHWEQIVLSSYLGLRAFAMFVGSMVLEVAWKAGMILLVWSAVDYLLTWQKQESDLRMSKEEIKKESKDTDGNPVIRQRIRSLQRRMRRMQSLKAAELATVVVTNPTHFAVALRYEEDMTAPVVVAKGRDLLAEKIKQMARDKGILLMENRALAQALYKTVEVGDVIPSRLYQAVAEILVVVFRAQAEVRQQEAARRSRNASGEQANAAGTRDQRSVTPAASGAQV
ncbi:MAG TPA: EscU/YscU/HrcU family type III secretion system export apparatus switch protein [Acidisarcina sp.]